MIIKIKTRITKMIINIKITTMNKRKVFVKVTHTHTRYIQPATASWEGCSQDTIPWKKASKL